MTGITLGLALVLGAALGWSGVVACAGIAAVAFSLRDRDHIWLTILVLFSIVGCLRVHGREQIVIPDWADGERLLVGRVASGPVESGRAQSFDLRAKPDVMRNGDEESVVLCTSAPVLPELHFGDEIRAFGTIQPLDVVEGNTAGYLKSRGCIGSLFIQRFEVSDEGAGLRSVLDHIRRRMTTSLQATFTGDTGALMAGLVTGDDAGLSRDQRDAFIITGTSHVTAVSGSNLAVILVLLTVLGGLVGRAKTFWWQAVVVFALWGYVAIIGLSPPPFRAACVATLALGAIRAGRRPDFVTLSVIVAAAELVIRPADFDSLAFRLSTISAIALVLGLWRRSPTGFRGWLGQGVIATAVTQAATSPILIPTFGRFTIYAIPANLIVGPMCALAFPFVLIAGVVGLFSTTAATIVPAPAVLPGDLSMGSVSAIAALPYAESGSSLAVVVPAWVWTTIAVTVVIALSRECRGGIVRVVHELRHLDPNRRAVLSCATASAVVGAFAGLWVR